MKIRTSHVSNSSTSSYVITLKNRDKYYPLTDDDNLRQLFHDMLVGPFGNRHSFWLLQVLENHHGSTVSDNIVDFINKTNDVCTYPPFEIYDGEVKLNVDDFGSSMNSIIDCICEAVLESKNTQSEHYVVAGGST